MEIPEIIKALRRNMVETGSLICLGCGHEHNCSTHGCTIMREASNALENLNRRADQKSQLISSDKLIKLLRDTAPCDFCEYENGCNHTSCALMQEAADRLEKLSAATENKPLTNCEALFGTPEKIADILLPLLPTMEGWCPYCKHWVDGECKVNPHWDCKNALVNWLNQPYARKPEGSETP